MESITSLKNPRFKNALRLHSSRGRQKQGRIIVFGLREILRAATAGLVFSEFMVDAERTESPTLSEIRNLANQQQISMFGMPTGLFDKLAYGDRNDGVAGIANRPETSLDRLVASDPSLMVVLESLEKPGNLGAIARTADGCGANGLLIADPLTDVFHPNAIRASLATVFSVPLGCGSSAEIYQWLTERQFQIFVATPEATTSIYDVKLPGRVAFVFGNEAAGLSHDWRGNTLNRVKLPMSGVADSLNVSVTASLMMYEARRQQR